MILIADAGSTKTEWAIVCNGLSQASTFQSVGVNALQLDAAELRRRFADAIGSLRPDRIYFYGAGCVGEAVCRKVADALPAPADVASDMLGAARALLGRQPGIAAILGTGSNSALYDGTRLRANMPPMGYILGDEGSGAALGRRLLRTVYRTGLLRAELEAFTGLDYAQTLERVYRQPEANRFLASLAPFIAAHREALAPLLAEEFAAFFGAIAEAYPADRALALTGGIAEAFAPELRRAAAPFGFEIQKIANRPIHGLIEYHSHE